MSSDKMFETVYSMVSGCFSAVAVLHGENIIIIFKDMGRLDFELSDGNVIAIVDCETPRLVNFVSATKLPAITCGLSHKDTITLSSISADSAVITLQREIACFDGTVAEPQEIPVRFSGHADNFSLMAAAAVFILMGKIDELIDGTAIL